MKKIVLLTFIAMMFCQICNAFKEPDPNKWILINGDESGKYWLNSETVQFTKDSDGNSADFKMLVYIPSKDEVQEYDTEMKLDKKELSFGTVRVYDGNGNLKTSLDAPPNKQIYHVESGTMGEAILDKLKRIYNSRNSSDNYTLEEYTFKEPDTIRWRWIGGYDGYEYFLDTQTIEFSKKSYGNSAKVNLLVCKKGRDVVVLQTYEINLDEAKEKALTQAWYNAEGKLMKSQDEHEEFKAINPMSAAGAVYDDVERLYRMHVLEEED